MLEAMRDVLADPAYRENAQAISREFAHVDGASSAAKEIEALLRRNVAG
jgi:UDP:flavonoid glycosyltransferase YjiC (YdhE family)